MDQPEEILEKLERFNVQKNPEITRELDEYVSFVARTGESVFNWALVKKLYREKLINVITDFYNEAPTKELPQYPNVDPFNYETMKKMLIERLDSFSAAPFTIQRISELLADPRKQYSRIDKFMRAVEKNILVVSTVSPGRNRSEESENGDSLDSVGLNGDFTSDVNVDIDMENDGSFTMSKEFTVSTQRKEGNHEIISVNHETVTIKKIPSKEEEASTSTVAIDVKTKEGLQPSQTEVSIASPSTVTITVCEASGEMKSEVASVLSEEQEEKLSIESNEIIKTDEGVIKTDVTHEPITPLITSESIEPKIDDDALLNEPLRPVDDEILVDSCGETTPLAALENIVANRTDPTLIEVVEPSRDDPIPSLKQQEEIIEQEEQKASEADDSEIEPKRLKIEEVENADDMTNPQIEVHQDTVAEPITHTSLTEKNVESTPIIEESPEEITQQQLPVENIVTLVKATTSVIVSEQTIETQQDDVPCSHISNVAAAIVEEIAVPCSEVPEPQIVSTAAEGEMEATSIVEHPNTMSLDEDDQSTVALAEMEVTPATNKMDTDDNETENALMDVDADAEMPMDQ